VKRIRRVEKGSWEPVKRSNSEPKRWEYDDDNQSNGFHSMSMIPDPIPTISGRLMAFGSLRQNTETKVISDS
jgi:hypothetical protein